MKRKAQTPALSGEVKRRKGATHNPQHGTSQHKGSPVGQSAQIKHGVAEGQHQGHERPETKISNEKDAARASRNLRLKQASTPQRHNTISKTTRSRARPPRAEIALPTLPSSIIAQPTNTASVGVGRNTKSKGSTTTPTGTRLQTLHATATLLQNLHVRNRNQHRGQGWWKWFSILRRRMVELLRCEVRIWRVRHGEQDETSKRETASETRTGQAQSARARLELEERLVKEEEVLMGWLRETVVPKTWVAFTGLVGDSQFAGLGVVLLGVLGDIAGLVGGCFEKEVGEFGVNAVMAEELAQRGGKRYGLRQNLAAGEQALLAKSAAREDVGQIVQRTAMKPQHIPTTTIENTEVQDDVESEADVFMQDPDPSPTSHEPPSSPFADFDDIDKSEGDLPTYRTSTAGAGGPSHTSPTEHSAQPSTRTSSTPNTTRTSNTENGPPKSSGNNLDTTTPAPTSDEPPQSEGAASKDLRKQRLKHGKELATKSQKMTKKKSKRNAIDDLFAGLG